MTYTSGQSYGSMPPSGWYPDPAGGSSERYWDGSQWTTHLRQPPEFHQPYAQVGQIQSDYIPEGASAYSWEGAPAHAAWGWRVLAALIDSILVGFLGGLLFSVLAESRRDQILTDLIILEQQLSSSSSSVADLSVVWNVVFLLMISSVGVVLVYNIVMLSTIGATVGKLAVGIKAVPVNDLKKGRLGWGRATVRQLASIVLGVIPLVSLINLLFPLLSRQQQTIHDMVAGTVVIKVR